MTGQSESFVDVDVVGDVSNNLQAVRKVFLHHLHHSGRHAGAQGEESLGFASGSGTLAHNNLVDRLHGHVLVPVGEDLAAGSELDHLLGTRSLAIVREGILVQHSGVAHVGVEGAPNDGQGWDVERGHLFCQDLRQTCE
jgi:hypothetical protein